MLKVPFFGLDRQYATHRSEFLDIADKIWSSGKVLQGEQVARFEKAIADLCHRNHAVALGSCTDALYFALQANKVGPGDEVLITPFSFSASLSPIVHVGAQPVFVDIDWNYFMMDCQNLGKLLTKNTKAILAVHLFGQTLDMDFLEDFCRDNNLVLIEDAAQALGSCWNNRPAGSMGDCSCISFDPTKVVGSFGSAGVLLTDNRKMADQVRAMRYHGRLPKRKEVARLGYNSQLPSADAAMLTLKLSFLKKWIDKRNVLASGYIEALKDIKNVTIPQKRKGSTHSWHKFVIRTKHREQLADYLKDQGISTMIHYKTCLCDEPFFSSLGWPKPACDVPIAREIAQTVLTLPLFPEMTFEELSYVTDRINLFFR